MQGERNVPPSPLICSNELSNLVAFDEIKDIFLCYMLPQVESLSGEVSHNVDVNVFPSFTCSHDVMQVEKEFKTKNSSQLQPSYKFIAKVVT